jgi:hypothetical protein
MLLNSDAGLKLVPFLREAPPLAKESGHHAAFDADSLGVAKKFLAAERLTNSGSEFAIGLPSC